MLLLLLDLAILLAGKLSARFQMQTLICETHMAWTFISKTILGQNAAIRLSPLIRETISKDENQGRSGRIQEISAGLLSGQP